MQPSKDGLQKPSSSQFIGSLQYASVAQLAQTQSLKFCPSTQVASPQPRQAQEVASPIAQAIGSETDGSHMNGPAPVLLVVPLPVVVPAVVVPLVVMLAPEEDLDVVVPDVDPEPPAPPVPVEVVHAASAAAVVKVRAR